MTHVTIDDIRERMYRRKRYWTRRNPIVSVEGNEKEFGFLHLIFEDEIVSWNLFIDNKQEILDVAEQAVSNFKELQEEHNEKMR